MKRLLLLLLCVAGSGAARPAAAQTPAEAPAFLSEPVYAYYLGAALRALDRRDSAIARLTTRAAWEEHQRIVRRKLYDLVGPLPARTPLEARTTGALEKPGYRLEKVVFASAPGRYVTAVLLVPRPAPRGAPAVLYCSGHAPEGFRSPAYQQVLLNLVRQGFVVLAFDPVGQGERVQYPGADGGSRLGGPTAEHAYPGAQLFLTGAGLGGVMIWDGLRAVDYLVARPEVDPERIAVAGRSGGGTQAAYLAAFDERIRAAAPESYVTSFRRLLTTAGPQDAEQVFFGALRMGIDFADWLTVRAPKPLLVLATRGDFFPIEGARETFREAQRAYAALGRPEAAQFAEDAGGHASTPANRERLYRFLHEALDHPGPAAEAPVTLLTPEELRVLPPGGVRGLPAYQSLADENGARAAALVRRLEQYRGVRRSNAAGFLPEAERLGEVRRAPGARLVRVSDEAYVLERPGRLSAPVVWRRAAGGRARGVALYAHEQGGAAAAASREAALLTAAGYDVLMPDAPGAGALQPPARFGDARFGAVSYNTWHLALLTGAHYVGEGAGALLDLADLVRADPAYAGLPLVGLGVGAAGALLLHAAALEPRIERVGLSGGLVSYRALAADAAYAPRFMPFAAPAALTRYDLPDLLAALAPRPCLVLGPVGASGAPAGPAEQAELRYAAANYARVSAPGALVIGERADAERLARFLTAAP